MDDALCGGGDPDEGYTNTAVTFSASALSMIKAAIFMGDPRFVAGKSYDVGTCEAGGVSPHSDTGRQLLANLLSSSPLVQLALLVHLGVSSNLIVMLRIPTAAMGTTRLRIRDMAANMGRRR